MYFCIYSCPLWVKTYSQYSMFTTDCPLRVPKTFSRINRLCSWALVIRWQCPIPCSRSPLRRLSCSSRESVRMAFGTSSEVPTHGRPSKSWMSLRLPGATPLSRGLRRKFRLLHRCSSPLSLQGTTFCLEGLSTILVAVKDFGGCISVLLRETSSSSLGSPTMLFFIHLILHIQNI